MRNALLISPFFLPSNLAGVHRVRVMSGGLAAHGWNPTVVAVGSSFHEETIDPSLRHLLPANVDVDEVTAWPAALCRPLGFGDISLRGQWQLRRRVAELVRQLRPAVIFATVLPGYTALVGRWAKRQFQIPFVLDYQDPWGRDATGPLSWNKAGVAARLSRYFEPKILPSVDALTAVSEETLASLRRRSLIRPDLPIEIIPIGADRRDHEVAARYGSSLIQRIDHSLTIAYVGTLTEKMLPALRTFLNAMASSRETSEKIQFHLIGTSARPEGGDRLNLKQLIADAGVTEQVHLHPARIGYLDALKTMQEADLLLLIGSTESHYTASKLFPYWLSGKPIMGIFHRDSTIVSLARKLGGTRLVLFDSEHGPDTNTSELAALLGEFSRRNANVIPPRNEGAFEPYSAMGIAGRYAELFNKVATE